MTRIAGAAPQAADAGLAITNSGAPLRMAFLYFPNGAIPASWWPTGEGTDFQLSGQLEPLADVEAEAPRYSPVWITATPPQSPDGARRSRPRDGTLRRSSPEFA